MDTRAMCDNLWADDNTIAGVLLYPLKIIATQGGPVLHMLRSDNPLFTGFGEIYFSEVDANAVKAWKRHRAQTQRFAVPVGLLEVVIYDSREGSLTQGNIARYQLGRPHNYSLLQIPPLLWYGFTSAEGALLANCADIVHQPDESEKLPVDTSLIPFTWGG